MKTILLTLSLTLFQSIALATSPKTLFVTGPIVDVQLGEVDPFEIGDACILEVETKEMGLVGLVTDYDACLDYKEINLKNYYATAYVLKSDKIKRKAQVEALKMASSAESFYWVEFGHIENGLSDEPIARKDQITLNCRGIGKDKEIVMSLTDLATRKVIEGQKNPVRVELARRNGTLKTLIYSDVVQGTTEDVQWFLKSKDQKTFSATVFMDELYDVSVTHKGREYRFNCEGE